MTACDAKIRPFPGDTEVICEEEEEETRHRHHAVLRDYAYAGSATLMTWDEDDRRTFRGDWRPCDTFPGCVLPAAHRGRHAT